MDNRLKLPDGRWLGYDDLGDPRGRPVVYCHGGLSSRLDMQFADRRCQDLGVRLLALDRPGIGLSDYRKGLTLKGWARDVEALADALHLEHFEVLGWSLGGAYALACGYHLAPRVTRVITVGGVAPLDFPGCARDLAWLDRLLFWCGRRRIPGLARAVLWLLSWIPARVMRSGVWTAARTPADRQIVGEASVADVTDLMQEAFRVGVQGAAADYRKVAQFWGFNLQDVKVDVDLFWGEDDRLCPRAHTDQLAARLPKARLQLLPGRGHFLLRTDLEEVLKART